MLQYTFIGTRVSPPSSRSQRQASPTSRVLTPLHATNQLLFSHSLKYCVATYIYRHTCESTFVTQPPRASFADVASPFACSGARSCFAGGRLEAKCTQRNRYARFCFIVDDMHSGKPGRSWRCFCLHEEHLVVFLYRAMILESHARILNCG